MRFGHGVTRDSPGGFGLAVDSPADLLVSLPAIGGGAGELELFGGALIGGVQFGLKLRKLEPAIVRAGAAPAG